LAIVRELITVLGTAVDQTGFKQYETGIARVKALALSVGAAFGIAFSMDKIVEFADGLVDAGKEINKITAQLKLIARPMDDVGETTKGVYELSQRLGVSYVHMLDTYKEFANEVRDTNIPTEKLLTAVETIQKGFEVARATPEQQSQVMDALQRGFRSGKMRPVSVGLMKDILPPEAFNMLLREFNLGVGDEGEAALREMAKAGEISAERVVEAFSKANAKLDKQFDEVPKKIGRTFTKIYNDLSLATAAVYKLADASTFFARIIWFVWVKFRDGVVSVVDALGGLKSVVELVGYALLVAFGPWLLATLVSVVAATLTWAAANAVLIASFGAMGVAVTAIAFAIEDIVAWVGGTKKNWIGTHVGPFAELAENFKKLDIFSGFRMMDDLIKGDYADALKEFQTFTGDIKNEIALVIPVVATIGGAFALLSKPIEMIIGLVVRIGTAALEATGLIKGAAAATEAAAAAKVAGAGATGAGTIPPGNGLAGPRVPHMRIGAMMFNMATLGANFSNDVASPEGQANLNYFREHRNDPMFNPFVYDLWDKFKGGYNTNVQPLPATPSVPVTESDANSGAYGIAKAIAERMWYGPESIRKESASVVPSVTPGAVAPSGTVNTGAVDNSINPVLHQSNNIHVETTLDAAQIGAVVQGQMNTFGEQLINGVSRQIRTSNPIADAAKQ
jgi:Tape measure protein